RVLLPSGCSSPVDRFERCQTFKPKDASHLKFPASLRHHPQKMDFEETLPVHLPLFPTSDGDDETLSDRQTLFAEYVDMAKLLPKED
ncbi:MAG: hypothetical protein ACREV9_00265, partial [Burkholderiales bacterium]